MEESARIPKISSLASSGAIEGRVAARGGKLEAPHDLIAIQEAAIRLLNILNAASCHYLSLEDMRFYLPVFGY